MTTLKRVSTFFLGLVLKKYCLRNTSQSCSNEVMLSGQRLSKHWIDSPERLDEKTLHNNTFDAGFSATICLTCSTSSIGKLFPVKERNFGTLNLGGIGVF